jgi:hypothetical protein
MNRKILTAALAGALGLALVSGGVVAQSQGAKSPSYKSTARVAGKPDLSGVWSVMNTANWDIEPHAARAALMMRQGPIVPVPAKHVVALGAIGAVPAGMGVVEGGKIPYNAEGLKLRDENRSQYYFVADEGQPTQHLKARDPEVNCYLPGVPRANYMHLPFQIFHSDRAMLIAYEYAGAVRNVLFTDPGPAPVDSWMGQSVAKWEGDTLVVTVTGQLDRTWFDRAGNHHSGEMKVVERWTPTSANTMRYEAEITDPATFTRPWKMSMNLYRRLGEDNRLQQFKCVEFVEEFIYGHLRKEPITKW